MQQDLQPSAPSGLSFLTALRIMSGFVASMVTIYLVWLIPAQMNDPLLQHDGEGRILFIVDLVIAFIAVACLWMALRIHVPKSQKRMKYAALGGCIVGFVALIGGFIWPTILIPLANDASEVALLYAGPLGFVVGAVGGYIYALFRGQESVSR